jgi:hypothetical protein
VIGDDDTWTFVPRAARIIRSGGLDGDWSRRPLRSRARARRPPQRLSNAVVATCPNGSRASSSSRRCSRSG